MANEQERSSGDAINEAIKGVLDDPMSRRDFVKRTGALGASAGIVGALIAAAGAAPVAARSASRGAAADAAYDPKKYAGSTINIMVTGDENDHRALADLVPQLKEETGIDLVISAPALSDQIAKMAQQLALPQAPFELYEYLGFLTTSYNNNKQFMQLNELRDDPTQTPADWDWPDFISSAVNNVSVFDPATGAVGQGDKIFGVPGLHSGSVIYFYRTDLFEAANLKPATTWDEFKAAAVALNTPDVAGCSFIGANNFSLATVSWFTTFITSGGVLMTGSPQTKDFKPNLTSPEAVGALQYLIDLLPYAPANVASYGFQENVDGFSSGKIAQMVFWSTIAGPIYDPDKSLVADKVGAAVVPAATGHTPAAILGGWGTGIPANVDPAKKDAAWRVLTWITSKETNKSFTKNYQIDASRTSTYTDPDLIAQLPYLPVAGAAMDSAQKIQTTVLDDFFGMNAQMNVEFNKALIGGQTAEVACANVQALWEASLRKAGVLV